MPSLSVPRPSHYAAPAGNRVTPSSNGPYSPPNNVSRLSPACRRPIAAALHPYDERVRQLRQQAVLYIDELPTKEGKTKNWIWTFVAATFMLFATRTSRAADILTDWLGEAYAGVIHCDRARMYWSFGRLQWCWAHLKRDFKGLIDSPCHTARRLGRDLMRPTKELFALWQKVRDGTLSRAAFVEQMKPIRAEVESLLLRG